MTYVQLLVASVEDEKVKKLINKGIRPLIITRKNCQAKFSLPNYYRKVGSQEQEKFVYIPNKQEKIIALYKNYGIVVTVKKTKEDYSFISKNKIYSYKSLVKEELANTSEKEYIGAELIIGTESLASSQKLIEQGYYPISIRLEDKISPFPYENFQFLYTQYAIFRACPSIIVTSINRGLAHVPAIQCQIEKGNALYELPSGPFSLTEAIEIASKEEKRLRLEKVIN